MRAVARIVFNRRLVCMESCLPFKRAHLIGVFRLERLVKAVADYLAWIDRRFPLRLMGASGRGDPVWIGLSGGLIPEFLLDKLSFSFCANMRCLWRVGFLAVFDSRSKFKPQTVRTNAQYRLSRKGFS